MQGISIFFYKIKGSPEKISKPAASLIKGIVQPLKRGVMGNINR
jgi:hypothetical protein